MTQGRRNMAHDINRERIKKVIKEEPELTVTLLAERFGVSLSTIRNVRKLLREKGELE